MCQQGSNELAWYAEVRYREAQKANEEAAKRWIRDNPELARREIALYDNKSAPGE